MDLLGEAGRQYEGAIERANVEFAWTRPPTKPREYFGRKLHAFMEGLDRRPIHEFELEVGPLGKRTWRCEVKRAWVFGSFRRGAAACHDVDLIVEVDITLAKGQDRCGQLEPWRYRKAMWPGMRDVEIRLGTPERNSSHASAEESALQLWGDGLDWHERIESIRPDPEAKRHSRLVDLIPFHWWRFGLSLESAVQLCLWVGEGMLISRCIRFPEGLEPLPLDSLRKDEVQAWHALTMSRGEAVRRGMSMLLPTMRCAEVQTAVQGSRWKGSTWGEFKVVMAPGWVEGVVGNHDVHQPCLVVPTYKPTHPNGIWVLEPTPMMRSRYTEVQKRLSAWMSR